MKKVFLLLALFLTVIVSAQLGAKPTGFGNGISLGDLTGTGADPTATRVGQIYWNDTLKQFREWDGTIWSEIGADIATSELARIAGSTFSTVQHLQDIFHSAGHSSGGIISDAGGNTIDVDTGTGLIRDVNDPVATLLYFDWSQSLGLSVPLDATRYVGVEYNGGAPQVVVRTTDNFDRKTEFILGVAVNEDGTIYIVNAPHNVGDHANNMIQRSHEAMGIQRDNVLGGIILGELGTRNISVTPGALWDRLAKFLISVIDTSISGTFDRYYDDGSGGHTKEIAQTQWNNLQFDDGTGVLATMSNNNYSTQWFYCTLNGALLAHYGVGQFNSLALAEDAPPPSDVPDRISKTSVLIGRLVFKKSDATAILIESAFDKTFGGSQVTSHSNLGNLTADDHPQYLLEDGTRALTGDMLVDALILIDGRDLSVDGTKLDLITGTNTGNQTLANTADATSHTTTLSASGGSTKFVEGTNITLTTTGTGLDGVVTIASTGGDVSKVGTPVNNQIGVWTGDGTLEGESKIIFDAVSNVFSIFDATIGQDVFSRVGNSFTDFGQIKATIETGTTNLESLDISTTTTSATANFGQINFSVDGVNRLEINDAGIKTDGIIESEVSTGTSPFTVASTTKVTNLNVDLLDGNNILQLLRSDIADTKTGGELKFNNGLPIILGTDDDLSFKHTGGQNEIDLRAGNLQIKDNLTLRFEFGRITGNFTATGDITGTSVNGVFRKKITLSSAQILALNTTPIQLVAAPGVGKLLKLKSVVYKINAGTPYATNVTLNVVYAGFTSLHIAGLDILDDVAGVIRDATGVANSQMKDNTALQMFVPGGDPITGTSTVDVYITYEIITL